MIFKICIAVTLDHVKGLLIIKVLFLVGVKRRVEFYLLSHCTSATYLLGKSCNLGCCLKINCSADRAIPPLRHVLWGCFQQRISWTGFENSLRSHNQLLFWHSYLQKCQTHILRVIKAQTHQHLTENSYNSKEKRVAKKQINVIKDMAAHGFKNIYRYP